MPSLVQTIRDMQEAAMTARQKKAIAAIEKDKKLSDSEKFKKIDAVMNEEEQIDEFHAPGMAPKPKKKPAPSSTKKSLGDISKRANEDKKICESCGKVHEGSCMEEKTKCPKCEGKGCDHCNDTGYHEETQVDEISKKKLGDYVKQASKDAASKSAYGAQLARDGDTKKAGKMTAKAYDRTKKIGKAVDRLTKEEVELDEDMKSAAKELEAYARKNGGIDKNDFMKAAVMMKRGQKPQLNKFVDELDTEPREKILSVMSKHMKEEVEINEDVDSLAKDFEARLKKQGYSSRTQDRERMATLAKAKKQGMNAMQMKQLDGKMNAIMNKMDESAAIDTQTDHHMDLLDTVNAILMGKRDEIEESSKAAMAKKLAKASQSSEKGKKAVTLPKAPWDKKDEAMDPVDKKALKKNYDDRKDKDIDNDGDEDDSDEYLHKKRQAVSKAVNKEAPKKKAKKDTTGGEEPVDVNPTLDEMMAKLEPKRKMFESKYGDRAQKVMEATAAKMAMKK